MYALIYNVVSKDKGVQNENKTIDNLNAMKKQDIFNAFYQKSSWHHTNMFHQVTQFYQLNEEAVIKASRDLTAEELNAIVKEREERLQDIKKQNELKKDRKLKEENFFKKYNCNHDSFKAFILFNDYTTRISKKSKNTVYEIEFNGSKYQCAESNLERTTIHGYSAL